jgi:D-alanine-D-alanine ligase-like ATP-grasp enzyme
VRVTGFLTERELDGYAETVDAVVGLRWPHVAETSGTLMRAMRAGRCVVKPAVGTSGGLGVTVGVETPAQLERALLFASRYSPRVLVEHHVSGSMYRLLFLDDWLLDIVRRDPPQVTGDGRSTVAQLISQENRRRLAAGARRELLRMDLECLFELGRAGLRPGSVVPAGTAVTVKCATSQGGGADSETVREAPSGVLIDEARAAVEAVGLRLAGVDLITGDLRSRLAEAGGAIVEVNGTPGLDYHYDVADPVRATRVAIPLLRRLLSEAPDKGVKPDGDRAEAYEEHPSPL